MTIERGIASVEFSAFDLNEYDTFLRAKKLPESKLVYDRDRDVYVLTTAARFAPQLDERIVIPPVEIPDLADWLFDYQEFVTHRALDRKRYAVWADCGLGKTPMGLEFGRCANLMTGGKVLFAAPPSVIPQWLGDAEKFYGGGMPIKRIDSREALIEWLQDPSDLDFAICSFYLFAGEPISEMRLLAAFILDESSILKSGGGKIKWGLIKSARGIEYKLSLTATPAPNDTMEFASQFGFLEMLRSENTNEILWTFFERKGDDGEWQLRPHAREAFFRFMASGSIFVRDPSRFGFKDNLKNVPAPVYLASHVAITEDQIKRAEAVIKAPLNAMDPPKLDATQRMKLSEIAKGFLLVGGKPIGVHSLKPAAVAKVVAEEVAAGLKVIVWTTFNEEAAMLASLIPGAERIDGSATESERERILDRLEHGDTNVVISKASVLGFGRNLQFVGAMVCSGFNDSNEQFYQMVRRAYRYGQTRSLRVHIPYIPELEGQMWDNLLSKAARSESDASEQEHWYLTALREEGLNLAVAA
ncbi:helicase-related protein [Fimbriimonas ginsengisoli]|uniref:Helicase domain protein n=1 Tax=Fimbriimonas ginsengisoli Gsoil 348 TaxID=661478 RepID=A0A068NL79_FIMGI|nr:helicase-related protein [Fimbriimonas ginsengisoli]AIE83515.1 helicase domain protein [Fimbriimonas ginsengisoli Gsoil 348]